MSQRIRSHLTYANVMVTLLAFIVLGGGTALASYVISSNSEVARGTISGHNPPAGKHQNIIPGSLNNLDLAPGAITTRKLVNFAVTHGKLAPDAVNGSNVLGDSLTGADIAEPTLDQVPSALLGGLGRWAGGGQCNPPGGLINAGPFVNCASVTVDLPAPARLLLMGQATGVPEDGRGKNAFGKCRVGPTSGAFVDSTTSIDTTTKEAVSPVAVSGVFPAGQHSFGIDCNDAGAPVNGGGQIRYEETGIVAVAISPN